MHTKFSTKLLSTLFGILCAAAVSAACVLLFEATQTDNAPLQPVAARNLPYRVVTATPIPAPTATPTQRPPATPLPQALLGVIGSYRVTESNQSWTRLAWQMTYTNQTAYPLMVDVRAQFQDADGFALDEDMVYNVWIEAGATYTVSDYLLLEPQIATQIWRMSVSAYPR